MLNHQLRAHVPFHSYWFIFQVRALMMCPLLFSFHFPYARAITTSFIFLNMESLNSAPPFYWFGQYIGVLSVGCCKQDDKLESVETRAPDDLR